MAVYADLYANLSSHNQQHLLDFWDELTEDERGRLAGELTSLNLAESNSYFERAMKDLESSGSKLDERLQPIPRSHCESLQGMTQDKLSQYEDIGLNEIAKGAVGVLLMAGGQGTRLGSKDPKGMCDVGLPSRKTLFQIQAQRILRLQNLAAERTGQNGRIVWYIMTSEHTMHSTFEYLKKNNFFGLSDGNVVLFEQGSMPCYKTDGKIILDSKFKIATAPDGNGGLYKALRDKKILDHMIENGVQHLHAHSVDNILVKVADPVFIGYCVSRNADCAAKVVEKSSPYEAVGVVCKVDDRYQVVEYSEIGQTTAERRNADGSLAFNAGNICNHYFTVAFLKRVCVRTAETRLRLHVATKKIPFVDETGTRRAPDAPNGVKIEKFVFDVFPLADAFVALLVPRGDEFSALKNADAARADCPSTARADLFRLHRAYLRRAGAVVDEAVDVEISPLLSYAGENLDNVTASTAFTKSPIHLNSPEEILNGSTLVSNGHH